MFKASRGSATKKLHPYPGYWFGYLLKLYLGPPKTTALYLITAAAHLFIAMIKLRQLSINLESSFSLLMYESFSTFSIFLDFLLSSLFLMSAQHNLQYQIPYLCFRKLPICDSFFAKSFRSLINSRWFSPGLLTYFPKNSQCPSLATPSIPVSR